MEPAASSLRILLTDDDDINLQVGVALLESIGCRVDTATGGRETIEQLRRAHYDVILMDVQMPGMDGLETTRRIRAGFPPERQPRIIALTANVEEEDRRKCSDAGMDDFVRKPICAEELQEALEKRGTGKCAVKAAASATAAIPGKVPDGFDPEVVRELRAMSTPGLPDLFESLLRQYRTILLESLMHIQDAMAASDSSALHQAAHRLRGSSANLGAAAVAECCARLEALGEGGALKDAPALLAELEDRAQAIVDCIGASMRIAARREGHRL